MRNAMDALKRRGTAEKEAALSAGVEKHVPGNAELSRKMPDSASRRGQMSRSTRICVKNVPRYITDEKLREHFAQKGEVTDAKIIRTSDGRTRQFGFIGFKTAEEAEEAVQYFHRTFLDTSRLVCEIAQPIGSREIPRPWSRHSEGSSAFKEAKTASVEDTPESTTQRKVNDAATNAKGVTSGNSEPDPELEEFLQLMQPRSKARIWANDTSSRDHGVGPSSTKMNADAAGNKLASIEIETVDAFARRVPINKGKTSEKLTRSHVRFEGQNDSQDDEAELGAGVVLDGPVTDAEGAKKGDVVNNETYSDVDYLKSRVRKNWSDSEDEDEHEHDDERAELSGEDVDVSNKGADFEIDGDGSSEDQNEEGHVAEGSAPGSVTDKDNMVSVSRAANGQSLQEQASDVVDGELLESVAETGRLFVRNLPYTAGEEDLAELFSKFGQLSQVHLVLDKETKRSKGFAYILFMIPEDAVRAMEALDKSIFQGRLLHILAAKRPPPAPKSLPSDTDVGKTKYKTERESQRKAGEAAGDTRAWNTMFMRQDTIAENVALKYGMTKSELLDPEAGDLAVRMALGETHIIAETKRALSDEGVNVEILDQLASGVANQFKRSDRVILVKNLPFTTSEEDMIRMFSALGTLRRVILPPTKTLALVEFLEGAEARRAFKSLAYKRYQHVPLYLEWAPADLLTDSGLRTADDLKKLKVPIRAVGEALVKRAEVEQNLIGPPEADTDSSAAQARTLFVKNLNFSTTGPGLKKHFEQNIQRGSIKFVTIKTKPSKNGKSLSMGFGFVEFDSLESALDACKQLQGTVLEGHALVLQLSNNAEKRQSKDSTELKGSKVGDKNKNSTKVIVRNVAFEATRKDLQKLFSPFGQIKSLRLPKKFDGKHRGFAFIDFMTRQEAANAFSGLKSTHLYGRHLVLEQAKDDESLDELRARTAQQFFAENGVDTSIERSQKRRKQ